MPGAWLAQGMLLADVQLAFSQHSQLPCHGQVRTVETQRGKAKTFKVLCCCLPLAPQSCCSGFVAVRRPAVGQQLSQPFPGCCTPSSPSAFPRGKGGSSRVSCRPSVAEVFNGHSCFSPSSNFPFSSGVIAVSCM